MKCAIFSKAGNEQAQAIAQRASEETDGAIQLFDLSLTPPDRILLSRDELFWNGCNLLDFDIAFLHGFDYEDPVLPPAESGDLSLWRFDYLLKQQKYSACHSLFSELSRRGVKVINAPAAHLKAFMKPALLDAVRASGIATPDFTVTNESSEAQAFCEKHEKVVWRPATGRCAIQLFQQKQLDFLMQTGKPPVILAEAVAGPFVRAFLYEGEPWLLLQFESPSIDREEVLEMFWDMPCSESLAAQLAPLHDLVGAPWLQVSFVLNKDTAHIYDIDSDPNFQELPLVYTQVLTERLAHVFLGKKAPTKPTGSISAEEGQQRPTMFLRRMLDILYEFEQSKYS